MKKVGLVAGLGVGAGIFYYERLAAAFVERGAQPGLMISHADIGRAYTLVQQGAMEELAIYLNEHLKRLAGAGCEIGVIAAVTPMICAQQLAPIAALPLVDLFGAVNAELRRRGAKRVAVLGTQFVMQSAMFGRLENVEVIPLQRDAFDLVQNNYLIIARTGDPANADIEGVRQVALDLVAAGADTVILAGTELSLAFSEETAGFPVLDAGRVHINAVLKAAFED